jgi:hypothetical protein
MAVAFAVCTDHSSGTFLEVSGALLGSFFACLHCIRFIMLPGWATKGSYAMLAAIAVFLALFSLTQRIRPKHGLLFRPKDSAAGEETKTVCAAEQAAQLAAKADSAGALSLLLHSCSNTCCCHV